MLMCLTWLKSHSVLCVGTSFGTEVDYVLQHHASKFRIARLLSVPLELELDHSTIHDASTLHCVTEELILVC